MPKTFNLPHLRRLQRMHQLSASGMGARDIARKMNMHTDNVTRYLKTPVPKLAPQVSTWWAENAACLGLDTNLFFPTGTGESAAAAKREAMAICSSCPVRQRCREAANANYEQNGIWGGVDYSRFSYRYNGSTGEVTVVLKKSAKGNRVPVTQVG